MPSTPSLLRYPGGKSSVYPMVSNIIVKNDLHGCVYAEPYAGGCGLALKLLLKGIVSKILLNDFDYAVWCLWKSVLDTPYELIKRIEITDVSVDQWRFQKTVLSNPEAFSYIDIGFAALFLNRTNRSGIIKGGVIGGIDQLGNYKLDCRFGKSGLIKKIEKIQEHREKIELYNLDAIDFFNLTDTLLRSDGFYCIDPPYFKKGRSLYTNFYVPEDHKTLAERISCLETRWILTYDNAPEIRALYPTNAQYLFNLNYSAGEKRKGTELMVASNSIETYLDRLANTA
jgi:DNA adenine methylase